MEQLEMTFDTEELALSMLGYVCSNRIPIEEAESIVTAPYAERTAALEELQEVCMSGTAPNQREQARIKTLTVFAGQKLVKPMTTIGVLTQPPAIYA